MESCEICFKKNADVKSTNPEYIAPMLLSEEKPLSVQKIWNANKEASWYFRYCPSILHGAFIHRFIVRAGRLAEEDKMWQNGIHFRFPNSKGLVQGNLDNNYIEIQVTGREKAKLLHLIRKEFKEIYHEKEEEIEKMATKQW